MQILTEKYEYTLSPFCHKGSSTHTLSLCLANSHSKALSLTPYAENKLTAHLKKLSHYMPFLFIEGLHGYILFEYANSPNNSI